MILLPPPNLPSNGVFALTMTVAPAAKFRSVVPTNVESCSRKIAVSEPVVSDCAVEAAAAIVAYVCPDPML
jgi:hypothetical protein